MLKKTMARIYRWILLSVMMQVAVLSFLNSYVSRSGEFKFQSIDLSGEEIDNTIETEIPSNVRDIKMSHDGTYIAYMQDGKLVIHDLLAEQAVKTIDGGDGTISYYEWLPDRNMVIYAIDVSTQYSGRIQLNTYEVDTDIEREYPVLKNLSKPCKVDAIELSTFTKVLYVKISNNSGRAVIYKFNIMNNLFWVMETSSETVIYEANLSDILFYQNEKFEIAYRDGSNGSRKSLGFKGKTMLLSVDAEDTVFVGRLNDDNRITAITRGKIEEPEDSWRTETLEEPVSRNQVYITSNGTVYISSSDGKSIYNLDDGEKIELRGKIVDIVNGYIASKDGNTLVIRELK